MSGEQHPPLPITRGGGDVVSGEQHPPLQLAALVELGTRPVRWLLDLGRARRLRRLRRAPVRMIDRRLLLRLGAGGGR